MRSLVVLALGLAVSTSARAEERALTAHDVQAQLKPVTGEIERCYLDRTADVRGAGHLALVLTVSRHGILEGLAVQTPGLAPRVAKQVDGCIREAIAPISFPARHTSTTATVPYFFQRTAGPGPQPSCESPSGCRAKP